MSNIFVMEAANLFCGDHDPTASNHLQLMNLQLPSLEQQTQAHGPGGGIMGVNFAMTMLSPLTFSFKLKGIDPGRLTLFGLGGVERRKYTAYGVIRDKRNNSQKSGVAVIEGVLVKIAPSSFSRADGVDHDYDIQEVTSYRLDIDNKSVFSFDFFTSQFEVEGVSQTDLLNRILRVPATA
jgi:phage tail tube protein FII